VARGLEGKERGVFICGPQDDPEFATFVSTLANRLSFPILADPLSQVRCGTHDRSTVIDCYDVFLRSSKIVEALRPEVVLRFGATPTSKALLNYLAQQRDAHQISVQDGDWQDPDHLTAEMFQTNPNQFTRDLAQIVAPTKSKSWLELWSAVAERSRSIIADQLKSIEEVFEGKVFSELAALLPSKAALFAGNSMPIRDLDAFYPTSSQEIRFLGNRGASGVDGVLSTSLGTAALTKNPLITVLGDLSFYHDMTGLLAAQKFNLNATIIVLNNNGGGIFSFLPQHGHPEYFEKYFATPHGLTFEHAATLYKLEYSHITSWAEFRKMVSEHLGALGTKIIELNTDRERNVELHHRISSAVTESAEQVISERV
jgi:2-succinyl-5-enolpyruvyl-6-hydroxy-3-cyclohexene-1-carboxylate synthase